MYKRKKGKVHNLKQEMLRKTDFVSAPTDFLYGQLFLRRIGFAELLAFSTAVDNGRQQNAGVLQGAIDDAILANTITVAAYNTRVVQGRNFQQSPLVFQNLSPISTHNNAAYTNVLSLGKTPYVESFKLKMQWFCPSIWLDSTKDENKHNQSLLLNMIAAFCNYMSALDRRRVFNARTVSWISEDQGTAVRLFDPENDNVEVYSAHNPTAQDQSTLCTNPNLTLIWLEQQKKNYRQFKTELKTVFGPLIQIFDDVITLKISRKDKRFYIGYPLIDAYDPVLKIDVEVKHIQFVTTYSHEGISPELLIISKGKILKRTNAKYKEVFKSYNPKYKTKTGRKRIKYKKNTDSKVFTYNQALKPKKRKKNRVKYIK